jgi:outer membrane protein OmpA-like peptidoglycan-associated protein
MLSQNLIKNPSFEDFRNCPEKLGNLNDDVQFWSAPTAGSTDYFNGCSTAMGTPENFKGSQPADFGEGYAGLYFYAPSDYREYLQAELKQTLQRGKKYKISFYVSRAERSDFAIKEFGVLFSNNKLKIPIRKELSKMHLYKERENKYNYMEIGNSNFYSDTQDWILVQSQFKAKGTENFISIGNFKSNARTRSSKTKRNARQGAYYYVDMVLLESAESDDFGEKPIVISVNSELKDFTLEKPHIFENLLFNFDEFELLEVTKIEIRRLFEYVKTNKTMHISIIGHTDSIGSEIYNHNLSQKRAETVANYLKYMGLSQERISWSGQGGTKPIASNSSEVGRQQNRRVEFLITHE